MGMKINSDCPAELDMAMIVDQQEDQCHLQAALTWEKQHISTVKSLHGQLMNENRHLLQEGKEQG